MEMEAEIPSNLQNNQSDKQAEELLKKYEQSQSTKAESNQVTEVVQQEKIEEEEPIINVPIETKE